MLQGRGKVAAVGLVVVALACAACGSTARSASPTTPASSTTSSTSSTTSTSVAPTTTTLPAGPAPLSAFPTAVGEAMKALTGHTTFPPSGPTRVDSTAPLSAVLNSGVVTATTSATPAGGYSVELFACPGGVSYPIGDARITADCDSATDTVAGFGALAMTTEAAAAAALPSIAGPGPGPETACPATSPTRSVGGVQVSTCGTAASPKASWTTGDWTIVYHLNPGEAVAATVAPLVARLATETLPADTGWLDIDEGGDGEHTTGAWADGDVVRTVFDYHSAPGAADLVISSRELAAS